MSDQRVQIEDVEEWVDAVLDEWEAQTWRGTQTWVEYVKERFALPPALNPNSPKYSPKTVQDAIVWLYDGGLRSRGIAAALHINRQAMMYLNELLSKYEDDDEDDEEEDR